MALRWSRRWAMGADFFIVTGFIGVAIVLATYFANQQRWLSAEDWRFPLANAAGSCLILVSFYVQWNLPSFVINASWAAISLYGLVKGARLRRPG
jgi:hypothetical protein